MNIRKLTGIMLLLLLGLVGCNKEEEEIGNNEFCSHVNTENIDKAIPFINDYLMTLPINLTDSQKLQELAEWLLSYPCITEATVVSYIYTYPAMSEIMISFKEKGITKDLILDIVMTDTLRVTRSHEYYTAKNVSVKTSKYFTINNVFEFINSFGSDIDVELIYGGVYNSTMSSDNLQYILDCLNAKPYTNDGNDWWVTGYLHYLTNQITIFPQLYNMRNKDYQNDWLKSMNDYKLVENMDDDHSGYVIRFKVPEGTERQWEAKFKLYEFVEWAELSYYGHIIFY